MDEFPTQWFVAFPDSDDVRDVLDRLPATATRIASHASGRPWLIGDLPAGQSMTIEAGRVRLVVLGLCPSTTSALTEQLSRVRRPEDLDRLAGTLRGSCHLALSVDGHYRLQGTISGLRRVFHTRPNGTVAADRADVLAALTGARRDEQWLALGLLRSLPHPLADVRTPWQGLKAVPADSALVVDPDGRARVRRWWTPPEPVRSLAEGAEVLNAELSRAVADRVRLTFPGRPVGCDLSGGMDSTSLCFLAHRQGAELVTITKSGRDANNDDAYWADLAAAAMPGLRREILDANDLPDYYTGIDEPHPPTDAPSPLVRGRVALRLNADRYAHHGVTIHLAGHGGDEVVSAPDGYLHDLIRRDPRTALDHLRGHRARRRWSKTRIARGLRDRATYAEWLTSEARNLTAPDAASPLFGWGPPLRMPPWATDHAISVVADAVRDAATDARPLAPARGQHQALQRIQGAGHFYRLMAQELHHPTIALPYLDDRVVEACLSVRLPERGTPWHFKPLLTQAMRGTTPEKVLARTTKATTATDCFHGLRGVRDRLLDLVATSPLVRHGLVDEATLRDAVLSPHPLQLGALEYSLSCASWRPLTPTTTPGGIT
ncbi:asparagine synthase-related protein [Amycolatopsis sp. NPDC052450]|uniref:asparagine synthase-related protein n=1 Tax=Amycolatopsis sp. NPDC052450 TaxID=3363937 RepID=UPI0037C60389